MKVRDLSNFRIHCIATVDPGISAWQPRSCCTAIGVQFAPSWAWL